MTGKPFRVQSLPLVPCVRGAVLYGAWLRGVVLPLMLLGALMLGASGAMATETHGARSRLVVATWNLQWLSEPAKAGPVRRNETDFVRLKKYASRLKADVVAVQEVQSRVALERVFEPAHYTVVLSSRVGGQRTGFVVRKGLNFTKHPDYQALGAQGLRWGTDLSVELGTGKTLRLLSVHLKSGCFQRALVAGGRACAKLRAQVPKLEAWIDARAREGSPFAVLGDFNRRFFRVPGEEFWSEIDDSEPLGSDLWSPTEGRHSRCWEGKYPHFIDHLVLGRVAKQWLVAGSFVEHVFDARDLRHKRKLSDHCPISMVLRR